MSFGLIVGWVWAAVLAMVAEQVTAAQWMGAAEVAGALRAVLVAASGQQPDPKREPEPEPEPQTEAAAPKLPKFRVDVKSGTS